MSVRPSTWNNSAPIGRIFMKSNIWGFSKFVEKNQFSLKSEKNKGSYTWRPICSCDHFALSSEWEMFQSCRENQNSHFIHFFQNTNLMHNSLILQQYVCYTTILNMFRAACCSSSGGQIVSPQPLVSSPSVNGRTVCRLRADCSPLSTCILYGCLQRVTIPEAVMIQFVLLWMSSVLLETCWGS